MTELKPCPFCNAELTAPAPVQHPKSGLAQLHPGSVDDGSCPIAGWGFYDEQLEHWNTRAAEEGKAELVECIAALLAEIARTERVNCKAAGVARAALARVRGEG